MQIELSVQEVKLLQHALGSHRAVAEEMMEYANDNEWATLKNNCINLSNRLSKFDQIGNESTDNDPILQKVKIELETSNSTAETFRSVRRARGLSILEVADRSGINRNTIGQIENGNAINQATLSTLSSIAHAIECDLRIVFKPFEEFSEY